MVKIKDLESQGGTFISVTSLPDKFIGKVLSVDVRDVNKTLNIGGKTINVTRRTLIMRVQILRPKQYEGMRTSLSYPKSTWSTLAKLLSKLGVEDTDELIGQIMIFVKKSPEFWGGTVRFSRYAFDFYHRTIKIKEAIEISKKKKKEEIPEEEIEEEEELTEEEVEGVLSEV